MNVHMWKKIALIWISFLAGSSVQAIAQDSLTFRQQVSAWVQVSPGNDDLFLSGARYIPQVNYTIKLPKQRLIDFEGSVNLSANANFHRVDEIETGIHIHPYRLWARYSSPQSEIRAGLQKINFGSASMLRPLSWFDQVDPRDPVQLTSGVWGVLGRHYFLNNANIWLWVLYGNEKTKTWEFARTNQDFPEAGGRFQLPLPKGEAALTYHFRVAETRATDDSVPIFERIPENRIGFDGKWDLGVGIWIEGAWITKSRDVGVFTNQEYITAGIDYTFGIGNGLNVIFEQMVASYDKRPFQFHDPAFLSALSLSYPIGIFDNLSAIIYYDWERSGLYSFVNWKKQFGDISLYVMGYWNPETATLPQQTATGTLYAGKGIRVLMVLNK